MRRATYLLVVVALALGLAAPAAVAQPATFRAVLSGADEVPPRDTQARGVATFRVSADDSEIGYRVVVANIENVFAAHIHCGDSDDLAPVGVTLFMGAPASGPVNGVLATGTITAPDAGNACGWTDLDDVIAALEAGAAYVNVHTNDGVAPPDTGPGDFPGGEIRGQIF
jgi:CHRD domain